MWSWLLWWYGGDVWLVAGIEWHSWGNLVMGLRLINVGVLYRWGVSLMWRLLR